MKQHLIICNRLRFLAWKREETTDMLEMYKIMSCMQEVKKELSYRDIIFALPSSKSTYENAVKLSDKRFSLKQKRNTFNNTVTVELTAQADSGN